MVRIALLPSSYVPSLGGVEELTRHLGLALDRSGDEVQVWTLQSLSEPETVEVRDGLLVRRLPMPLPATSWSALYRTATTGTRTLLALRRAVAAFRPDVLHVQCFGPNGAYAAAVSRMTGVPLVVTLQGETVMDDGDIFDISASLRWSLRSALAHAAAVTGCSAWTLADAEDRFGLAPGRGEVIFNGVDLGDDAGAGAGAEVGDRAGAPGGRRSQSIAGGRPYLFALGRVVEKKGFDLLLSAYASMGTDQRTADLVIAGAGASLESLHAQAGSLGIADRVHFVGRLDRDDVAAAMAGSELFVMPSRFEPFGIVVLEAWRAGTAVVATSRGGPPEFVRDGEDGVLVDPFDTPRFAAVLSKLLADPGRRGMLGRAGRRRMVDFGWQRIAEQYCAVYDRVMDGAGHASQVGGTPEAAPDQGTSGGYPLPDPLSDASETAPI